MSSLGYDEALLKKFKNWVKDDSLEIIGPEEVRKVFEYKIDSTNDKPLKLPMIVLRRLSPITINNISKRPLTFDGHVYRVNKDRGEHLNGIPITLRYQLDIYTRYLDENDEYVRNFVFNLINFPKVNIEIPYNNANITHNSHIILDADIEDNSDIPERLVQGQFTRRTISFSIDSAYMFDYKARDVIKIENVDVDIALKSDIIEKDNLKDDEKRN